MFKPCITFHLRLRAVYLTHAARTVPTCWPSIELKERNSMQPTMDRHQLDTAFRPVRRTELFSTSQGFGNVQWQRNLPCTSNDSHPGLPLTVLDGEQRRWRTATWQGARTTPLPMPYLGYACLAPSFIQTFPMFEKGEP